MFHTTNTTAQLLLSYENKLAHVHGYSHSTSIFKIHNTVLGIT